jgi:hypothetical protein
MKDKHEPNEVGYGVGNTGKPGSTNLHPGAPERSKDTGKVGKAFEPNQPSDREKAVAAQAPSSYDSKTEKA